MNMNAASEFAQSIAEAARVNQPRTLDDTLQTVVEVACNSVPGFDQVAISTLQREGKVKTRACIGDLVRRLDEIQYGPGARAVTAAAARSTPGRATIRGTPGRVG